VRVWLPPAEGTDEEMMGASEGSLDINHIL
jgi:hypothetical protein